MAGCGSFSDRFSERARIVGVARGRATGASKIATGKTLPICSSVAWRYLGDGPTAACRALLERGVRGD